MKEIKEMKEWCELVRDAENETEMVAYASQEGEQNGHNSSECSTC